MVTASHWVGLTLPGIILEPGSFSGMINSPRPQRGPDDNSRISLAIFIRLQATVFKAPLTSTNVSWQANDSNLLDADSNDMSVSFDISVVPFFKT